MNTENINIEDIKVGETYYVRVKVKTKGEDYIRVTPILQGGVLSTYWPNSFALGESSAFSPIPPENGRNNSEPAPKYSEPAPKYGPCRLFKAGDVVEYRPKDGRANPNLLVGRRYKVSADEPCDSGIVQVEFDGLRHLDTFVAYNNLELVTPVEELERYVVEPGDLAYFIVDKKHERGEQNVVMYMFALHPNAKEAAEAECARLNAEYRKEQS